MSVTVLQVRVIARDAYPRRLAHRALVTTAPLWATPLKVGATPLKVADTPADMPTKGLFSLRRS